jgi:hypothetical protein
MHHPKSSFADYELAQYENRHEKKQQTEYQNVSF